jgi:hypothetical protein
MLDMSIAMSFLSEQELQKILMTLLAPCQCLLIRITAVGFPSKKMISKTTLAAFKQPEVQ